MAPVTRRHGDGQWHPSRRAPRPPLARATPLFLLAGPAGPIACLLAIACSEFHFHNLFSRLWFEAEKPVVREAQKTPHVRSWCKDIPSGCWPPAEIQRPRAQARVQAQTLCDATPRARPANRASARRLCSRLCAADRAWETMVPNCDSEQQHLCLRVTALLMFKFCDILRQFTDGAELPQIVDRNMRLRSRQRPTRPSAAGLHLPSTHAAPLWKQVRPPPHDAGQAVHASAQPCKQNCLLLLPGSHKRLGPNSAGSPLKLKYAEKQVKCY